MSRFASSAKALHFESLVVFTYCAQLLHVDDPRPYGFCWPHILSPLQVYVVAKVCIAARLMHHTLQGAQAVSFALSSSSHVGQWIHSSVVKACDFNT